MTDIVNGEIKLDTTNTYAIEKQAAIAVGYESALSAWNAATNYTASASNYYGQIFDNVGWVRGTKSVATNWGAYLWVLQNRIKFQAGTSEWWSTTNGIPVRITNVMVGSLGNYQATSNVDDIGPVIPSNFPGANLGDVGTYQVDITNVFYELVIPDIWITPRDAVACVDGSNVEFTVTGTNIPLGVAWTISPTNFEGHAGFQASTNYYALVTPGSVATNYKVRATSKDNTNFYDEVNLIVLKVDVANIKFNHNMGASANDSINIRQDYNTAYDISNGEWIKDGTNIPVCYTTNTTVTIKARLTITPAVNMTADIWAESTDSGGSLGDVIKTNVAFSCGVSSPEYVTFQISGTTPNCIKKTTTDIWEWKFENVNGSGSSACNLNTSGVHTVYTILNEPAVPWNNTAGNQKNAWVTALNFAIMNAGCNGDSNPSNAMTHISQYLHGSSFGMTYDTTNGASYYGMWGSGGDFNLTAYSEGGGTVNCYDQAAGVIVYSRLFGISSDYLFMNPFGYILQTDLVGIGDCNNPFFNDYTYTNRIHNPLVDAGISDRIETERSMFGNHAIVGQNGNIYDSTCGPRIGSETLVQYATSSIDISSPSERPPSPDGTAYGGDTNGMFSVTEVDSAITSGDVNDIH